jgi:threonine dehydratase
MTVTLASVVAARRRIQSLIRKTPSVPATNLSRSTGVNLWLKLETRQVTGSFKERGAANKLLLLSEAERAGGVVAASAGNHAQGLAINAARLGIDATIVMPEYTPIVKVTRTRGYGGNVILHGGAYDEAAAYARILCEEQGKTFVHAFDDHAIIAGQGTAALELLDDLDDLDAVIIPVGGGGLLSGMGVVIKAIRPEIEVIGVQTEAFPSMVRALALGERIALPPQRTIADGIAVGKTGEKTFELAKQYVDRVIEVSEEAITTAIVDLLEQERVVSEGAAAAALAAVTSGKLDHLKGKNVCLMISGGNIDVNLMADIIDRGLVRSGRRIRLVVVVPDLPGTLARVTEVIAASAANVLEIRHERAFSQTSVGETDIALELETTGPEHVALLKRELQAAGYMVR